MYMKQLLIACMLFLVPAGSFALEAPQLKGRVNDYAAMLSSQTASGLERKLAEFERATSNQVVVLTIPTLEGDVIESFAIRVAEAWKIGQKGKDNGVLLILAKQERKIRIEVGMGLQGVLPDITASQITRNVMVPLMKAGKIDEGISAGVDAIISATKGEFKASPKDAPKKAHKKSSGSSWIIIFLIIAAGVAVLGYFSRTMGGAAGAVGLPLAAFLSIPGIGFGTLIILVVVGVIAGILISMLVSSMFGGGSGGYHGGGGYWGGGGFYGGGSSGGSGGDSFSGGGGDFDGGGSSDDY